MNQGVPPLVRFMKKVHKEPNGCWRWIGAKYGNGYGQFWNGKRQSSAHHFLLPEPIPAGKEACHKCDFKLCVNPDHIFVGTHSDNMKDSAGKGRHYNQKKTHCKSGHEFTKSNTYMAKSGQRTCRKCQCIFNAAYKKARATKQLISEGVKE